MAQSIKGVITAATLLGLAALGPAPIRPIGTEGAPRPERSEVQRSAEQRYQGFTSPLGSTEVKESEAVRNQVDPSMTDPAARDTVATVSPKDDAKDAAIIANSEAKVSATPANKPSWLFAMVGLGGGFGLVMVAKRWAEKQADFDRPRVTL